MDQPFSQSLGCFHGAIFPTCSVPQLLPMPTSILLAPSSCLELTFYIPFNIGKMNIRCHTGLLYSFLLLCNRVPQNEHLNQHPCIIVQFSRIKVSAQKYQLCEARAAISEAPGCLSGSLIAVRILFLAVPGWRFLLPYCQL